LYKRQQFDTLLNTELGYHQIPVHGSIVEKCACLKEALDSVPTDNIVIIWQWMRVVLFVHRRCGNKENEIEQITFTFSVESSNK